ncbi:MAG: DUF2887 domain-containing protein [Planctomycetota bacterium]|nr:DUF2887 domain-containing protein [Planctomycetota bacterium]
MKTDKQIWRIFAAVPEWIFLLTQEVSPGECDLRSLTVKALERTADGLLVPRNSAMPVTVIEFQFQFDDKIYPRIVTEMAAAQVAYDMRVVKGLILFGYDELDPATTPWTQVVQSFNLGELFRAFESDHPEHPLVSVFKPLMTEDEEVLTREAANHYRQIRESELEESLKTQLLEVFVNWLEQRFRNKQKQEIETMLIGELPDLEETQSGKDLIAIGEKRGEKRGRQAGLVRALTLLLKSRSEDVDETLLSSIQQLDAADADRLMAHLLTNHAPNAARDWLDSNS